MQLPKDLPLNSFAPIKHIKQGNDTRVDLVKHVETGNKYILKSFDRDKVMQNGTRIDQVLNESNILKLIAGIPAQGPFSQSSHQPETQFVSSLNRLATTTKDDDTLCLVLQ